MKKKFLFFLLFIFGFFSVLRAEEIKLNLDEALALALRDNRQILLKKEEVKKAKFKIAQAKAGLFPNLSVSSNWSETKGFYNQDIEQLSSQISLKQILYKGGKIINTIKYNQLGLELSKVLLDKEKQEIAFNTIKAFYTILLTEEFSQLNKAILENTQKHLAVFKARYQKGEVSSSDLLKLEESLSNVEEIYQVSLNQLESAQELLRNLLFLDKEIKIKAQGEFVYEPKELIYDEAFLKALKLRPEIRQYEIQTEQAKKMVAINKADQRPTISASWDYYSHSHTPSLSGLSKNWNDYNIFGISFSWPIFDGFATKAKVEEALVDLKATQLLKEKIIKDIALELKNAYLNLKDALIKIKTAEKELALYQDTLLVTQEKYKSGLASFLDLEDAHLGYQVALFKQKEAIYDYIIAKANFEKVTGGS